MKEDTNSGGDSSWLRVSRERAANVIEDITLGSDPKFSFYALLVASSLIAAFGLIANSIAVVIGAMLVSPLMTPIMGIALGLVRGDAGLLRRAFLAEVLGIVLAIGMAALFGFAHQHRSYSRNASPDRAEPVGSAGRGPRRVCRCLCHG
jgi:uncharacterized membrane protein